MEQHLPEATSESTSSADASSLCEHNRICNALGLHTLEMADFDDPELENPSPSKSTAKKPSLDFLVHEKDIDPRA